MRQMDNVQRFSLFIISSLVHLWMIYRDEGAELEERNLDAAERVVHAAQELQVFHEIFDIVERICYDTYRGLRNAPIPDSA